DKSCGGLNAFDLYRIGAAYTTSDGGTAPTPVDGGTNNDQDNVAEGDGDTAPTPVDGETNNDPDNGTEGDGDTAPTPVDGGTDNDQGNDTEDETETTPSDVTIQGAFSEDIVRIIDVEGVVPGGASWSDSYSVGS
ncbi:unnamed protein product, partial [Ectocarpus sp. 12 AP-2014]